MNNYRAVAYSQSLPGGQAAGDIRFTDDEIQFRSEKGSAEAPLLDLQIRLDGSGGKQAFFTHPKLPGWQILLMDPAGLKDRQLQNHPFIADTVKKAERQQGKWPRGLKFLIWATAGLTLATILLFLSLGKLANAAAQQLPKEQEIALGKALAADYLRDKAHNVPPDLQAMLDKATARLLPVVKDSGYTFEFHIIEDPSLNAFAIPGGQIFVHTGLLKLAKRPEQVAGVLAHEIAHVTRRHTVRNILQTMGLATVIGVLTGGADAGTLAGAGDYLLSQKFSRDMEREADDTGWEYLKQAKIDPTGVIEFFEIMKKEEGLANGIPDILSTHPATQERINELKAKLASLPKDHVTTPL